MNVYAAEVRRITWWFLIATALAGAVLGAALRSGASVGTVRPGPLSTADTIALWALIVGIPVAIGFVLSLGLELYDRLPARRQRWLRSAGWSTWVWATLMA